MLQSTVSKNLSKDKYYKVTMVSNANRQKNLSKDK